MKEAAAKHKLTGYESSSEEEELESENILGSVLKSYASLGGTNEDLGRTQNFLEDAFQSGAAICLVCIATVKRNDHVCTRL
ncbi:NF-X1-type zinc finger protein NFXL1-like [Homalodisca vitripennis]|nr:NF-X1-type zinc finger protein NFXL1-like [Homalodisca vitripennis]